MWFANVNGFHFATLSPKQMTKQLENNPKKDGGTLGGSTTSIDGLISIHCGNEGACHGMIDLPPVGEWHRHKEGWMANEGVYHRSDRVHRNAPGPTGCSR
jgi:hypothetical protein